VLQESKSEVYNVVLGLVDVMRGTNSYYKLQLLESDKSKKYGLFISRMLCYTRLLCSLLVHNSPCVLCITDCIHELLSDRSIVAITHQKDHQGISFGGMLSNCVSKSARLRWDMVRVVVLVLVLKDKFKVLVLVLGAQVLVIVLVLDTQVLVLVVEEKSLVVSLFLVFFCGIYKVVFCETCFKTHITCKILLT